MQRVKKDSLVCPICLEIPPDTIFHCRNGHSVCGQCSANLEICATCRLRFDNPKIRNLAFEQILENMEVNCPHASEGCRGIMLRSYVQRHMESCEFRPISLCQAIGFADCAFSSSDGRVLVEHLKATHKVELNTLSTRKFLRLSEFLAKPDEFPLQSRMWISQACFHQDCPDNPINHISTIHAIQNRLECTQRGDEGICTEKATFLTILSMTPNKEFFVVFLFMGNKTDTNAYKLLIDIPDNNRQMPKISILFDAQWFKDVKEYLLNPVFCLGEKYLLKEATGCHLVCSIKQNQRIERKLLEKKLFTLVEKCAKAGI